MIRKRGKFLGLGAEFTSVPLSQQQRANGLVQCADFCRKLPVCVLVWVCVCSGKYRDITHNSFLAWVKHLLEPWAFYLVRLSVCWWFSVVPTRDLEVWLRVFKRQGSGYSSVNTFPLCSIIAATHGCLIIHACHRHVSPAVRWKQQTTERGWEWRGEDAEHSGTNSWRFRVADGPQRRLHGAFCVLMGKKVCFIYPLISVHLLSVDWVSFLTQRSKKKGERGTTRYSVDQGPIAPKEIKAKVLWVFFGLMSPPQNFAKCFSSLCVISQGGNHDLRGGALTDISLCHLYCERSWIW